MNKKYISVLLFVLLVAITTGWQLYKRGKSTRLTNMEIRSYLPVEVKVEDVFSSGRGFRRSTLLTVSYSYKERKYSKTIRTGGYVEGQYKKGDVLTFYLDPDDPDKLSIRMTSDF
jgi:hypothetical protein